MVRLPADDNTALAVLHTVLADLGQHTEWHVTRKLAAGRYYWTTSGGTPGYHSRDYVSRYYGEHSRSAVNADAARAGQILPRISTTTPNLPSVGFVSTNGPKPTDRLKTVPSSLAATYDVVPYKPRWEPAPSRPRVLRRPCTRFGSRSCVA
jgi:hypothetical protein